MAGYSIVNNVSVGCGGLGNGLIFVSGVTTFEDITLYVEVKRGEQVISTYNFGLNRTNDEYIFSGLTDGKHKVVITPTDNSLPGSENSIQQSIREYELEIKCGIKPTPVNDLILEIANVLPASDIDSNDGAIQINISSSNEPIKTRLNDGELTENKIFYENLLKGTYEIYAQDKAGHFKTLEVTIGTVEPEPVRGCTDPDAINYNPNATVEDNSCIFPEIRTAKLFVPMANSLRFIIPVAIDGVATFKDFDNTLYCEEEAPGIYKPLFYQKINKSDSFAIQFRTNFANASVDLLQQRTNILVRSFVVETKENNNFLKEALIDLNGLTDGIYYFRLQVADPEFSTINAITEPISLKDSHPETVLVSYKGNKNSFDMIYKTEIENKIRVRGRFYQRKPEAERNFFRDCENRLINLGSQNNRKFLLELFSLPGWLHEKIFIALNHSIVKINGIEYQSEEGYEFEYNEGYALSNGNAIVEQIGWFGLNNEYTFGESEINLGSDKYEFNDEEFN